MTPRAVLAGLGVLVLVGAAVPASAQSRRYPPTPVDKDAERAAKSNLWSAAVTPERHPYQELVRAAGEALGRRTPAQTLEAIKKLDQAVQLLPREPDAYRLRAEAHLERRNWAKCAADFAAADATTRRTDDPQQPAIDLHLKLGICQARAGKLGDAEKTLAETAAAGNASPELWLRLGEVRIAMGKLDEAISALKAAHDVSDAPAQAMIHFLLAAAYDRARRPADAQLEAGAGAFLDKPLSTLTNPVLPPISAGELDYLLGLAYSADAPPPDPTSPPPKHPPARPESTPPRPEHALASFRRFVMAAPTSPWRKRAEEHIRDLKATDLPETMKRGGNAPFDLEAARAAARRAMPQMRACLTRLPAVAVEVVIGKAGPRTPPTNPLRPRFFSPPAGVTVRRAIGDVTDNELDAIDRCLQPLATQLPLPPVKERDTYYTATFYVVGP